MIPVTKPYLPEKHIYDKYINEIWEREWLTNHGPLVLELESRLKAFSGSQNTLFISNGTIALQIAIKALGLKGEIITTPFSYVATTSCIVWENCVPVFADIDPYSWNISVEEIEKKITAKTSAILATHVFGIPCEIKEIEVLAKKYNLKVIYDAAHAFGSEYAGESLLNFGDISICSFHATKLFHTVEGGGIFCNDNDVAFKSSYMRNFGHNGTDAFWGIGINGKNSEFHAAMGLSIWPDINKIIERRRLTFNLYKEGFKNLLQSGKLQMQIEPVDSNSNKAYVPVLFKDEKTLLRVIGVLNEHNIFPRRYFHPSLNTLPYVSGNCPIAENISQRIICLPTYYKLGEEQINYIVDIINNLDFL